MFPKFPAASNDEKTAFKLIIVSTNSNQLSKFCNPVLKISFHSATGNYSVGNQDMTQPDKSLPQ